MLKWFAYIVLLLLFAPCLSSAEKAKTAPYKSVFSVYAPSHELIQMDTLSKKLKQQQEEEKKKVKEISKAKRQAKPEKIDDGNAADAPPAVKPKRQRRPEGMERPPEIPRRNEN
ncbi:MAG: hypothetical protein ABI367_07600 [Mucilaginibacter sp.]